jgi:hypothetical protein
LVVVEFNERDELVGKIEVKKQNYKWIIGLYTFYNAATAQCTAVLLIILKRDLRPINPAKGADT